MHSLDVLGPEQRVVVAQVRACTAWRSAPKMLLGEAESTTE